MVGSVVYIPPLRGTEQLPGVGAPPIPANALLSAINGQPLTSAVDGDYLRSAA